MDDDIAHKIVALLIIIFQRLKRVTENGLIAFSGLCNGIGDRIKIDEIGQYIVWALKGDDDECVRIACGIISDLANALGEGMQNYLFDFVNPILDILKDPKQHRDSKLSSIVALGDLAMNCGAPFITNYLTDVLKILESAAKQSLQVSAFDDDEDMKEYLSHLRSTIVECYTSIVHGVTTTKNPADRVPLIKHSPTIIGFIA